MRFGFVSSVAPGWTLDQLAAAAGAYGFEAVELRVAWGHAAAVSGLALGARLAQPSAAEHAATVG